MQNHPQSAEPRYDAINEVYFDDLASMQSRVDFFARHDVLTTDRDLVGETHFAVVIEHVIQLPT